MELVFFWALSEFHIQFSKQAEENDSLFCDKEFIVNKESDIEKMDWAISTYVRSNLDDVILVHYFIKIDQKRTRKYLDEYLRNCIADNMEDNDVLLYSFEKQLEEIRKEIIHQKYFFGKRRFEIKMPFIHTIKKPYPISLFSVLYYLEQKGHINIEAPAWWPKDFDCSIPESFIVSITDNWITYFDQFDSQKKIDALLSKSRTIPEIASEKQNYTQVSFNDKAKELIIGWKIKKLKQKQIIFIDSLFDLQNKINNWWVGLDDIAIAEDHAFEEKSEAEQEKIIKNFYDIGNHLNKSIKLETGFEKVLEITTQGVLQATTMTKLYRSWRRKIRIFWNSSKTILDEMKHSWLPLLIYWNWLTEHTLFLGVRRLLKNENLSILYLRTLKQTAETFCTK